jgi:peptidoglycan/LPS O-acetylase OafA/YrhL
MRTETIAAPAEPSPVGVPRAEPGDGRLIFIDAMRGVAALAVAAYHIERYGPLAKPASRIIAGPIENTIRYGWMGVEVFFVISGFVIAYSLRNAWMSPGYLGNYALRRSIRLDPPYWVTIAVALSLHFFGPTLLNVPSPMDADQVADPIWPQISWHALYLQNVMGYSNLSVGLWTLCIEVQFYLLYAIMLGVAQRLCGLARWQQGGGGAALMVCFAPLALISLAVYHHSYAFDDSRLAWLAPFKTDVCVLYFFWMFFLGMIVHWTLEGRLSRWIVWSYLACMAARYAWFETVVRGGLPTARPTIEVAVAGVAGAAIFTVGSFGKLATLGGQRWLQFLGKTSYSLYLIHYPVSHVFVHLADQWGSRQSWHASRYYDWYAAGCTALALAIALGAGYLLYIVVERPSQRLAGRFRRGRGGDTNPKRKRGATTQLR